MQSTKNPRELHRGLLLKKPSVSVYRLCIVHKDLIPRAFSKKIGIGLWAQYQLHFVAQLSQDNSRKV